MRLAMGKSDTVLHLHVPTVVETNATPTPIPALRLHNLIQASCFNWPKPRLGLIESVISPTSGLLMYSGIENPMILEATGQVHVEAWAPVGREYAGTFVLFCSTDEPTSAIALSPTPAPNWHDLAAAVFSERTELSPEQWASYADIVESLLDPIDV